MLAEARKRNLYDALVEKEAVAFLEETDENFDLVVALDVLPYTGALEDFFAAVAARLPAGGLFAISHETSNCATFEFLPSGRFAHSLGYIQRLCGDAFALARLLPTTLRLEAGRAVEGNIALLRRVES
jgi:predicted TPR repeat methyltransferase